MGARAKKPILAALAASSILLGGAAAADDAGERAFANELRILPAFTARLEHTVTVGEETRLEVARLEMAPGCAGFRLRYRTLPFEIWRAGTKVVTMPSGAGTPPRDRRESAGKLAALLFMVGSGAMPRDMDVRPDPAGDPRRLRGRAQGRVEPHRAHPVRVRRRGPRPRLRARTRRGAAPHRAERTGVVRGGRLRDRGSAGRAHREHLTGPGPAGEKAPRIGPTSPAGPGPDPRPTVRPTREEHG